MGKLLVFVAFLMLSVASVGLIAFPHEASAWLLSSSTPYQFARVGLTAILFLQLVTAPPRSLALRSVTALVGIGALSFTLHQSYNYHMELFDSFGFLLASIMLLTTALERPQPETLFRISAAH